MKKKKLGIDFKVTRLEDAGSHPSVMPIIRVPLITEAGSGSRWRKEATTVDRDTAFGQCKQAQPQR